MPKPVAYIIDKYRNFVDWRAKHPHVALWADVAVIALAMSV